MSTDVHRRSATWPLNVGQRAGRRPTLALAILLSASVGVLAGLATGAEAGSDAGLSTLIRFMAVVKAGMVLAAAGLVAWRMGSEMSDRLATGYIAAVCLMAMAPGLIWNMGSLVLASALFHSGLLFGLALAARDGIPFRK